MTTIKIKIPSMEFLKSEFIKYKLTPIYDGVGNRGAVHNLLTQYMAALIKLRYLEKNLQIVTIEQDS